MMSHLSLAAFLCGDCKLDFTRNIVVGVSGGADSLCLLDVLQRSGYPVVVAHVNHQLRPAAQAEQLFVQGLVEEKGLRFVSTSVNVSQYADDHHVSVEEAARVLRYRFLFDQAILQQAQAVAVGHTADDQAETVLMNFLRGSGLSGLAGMQPRSLPNAWSEAIPLVRPLLTTARAQTEAYCREHALHYVVDETNADTHYRRNLLRHDVIPALEQINPELRTTLARMARALHSDQQIVAGVVAAAWEQCVLEQGEDWVSFNRQQLAVQPMEVQRQLMRRALALKPTGLRDVGFENVERALAFLASPPRSGQSDLMGKTRLLIEADRVWVAGWEAALPRWHWPAVTEPVRWQLSGDLLLPQGWRIQASRVEENSFEIAQANDDPFQAYLDLAGHATEFVVRPRQPGERFQPLGMENGSIKLSDFMINQKLPRRARGTWPLVCWQDQVIWIPGYALCHAWRVRSTSRDVLLLRMTRS